MTAETFDVWRCPISGLFTAGSASYATVPTFDGSPAVQQTTCHECMCTDGAEGPFTAQLVAPVSGGGSTR